MAIIHYYDVYVNGQLAETAEKTDGITPSTFLNKYKGQGILSVKQRTERIIETVSGGCANGTCPVKVTY